MGRPDRPAQGPLDAGRRALSRAPALLPLLLLLQACATTGAATPEQPVPPGVHWVRTSAEHHAIFEEVYRWAGERVAEEARRRDPGSWAVVLDIDETVLDNSEYQVRRARAGLPFTPDSWNDWVREEAAPVLPGARRFVEDVRARGGRVILVTNRDQEVCDATRRNLETRAVPVDLVLCRPAGVSSKEPRFRAVLDGTASADLPALDVVAWVGDNIQDFPGGAQDLREGDPVALAAFGTSWFLLPNPMYGSWERNRPR